MSVKIKELQITRFFSNRKTEKVGIYHLTVLNRYLCCTLLCIFVVHVNYCFLSFCIVIMLYLFLLVLFIKPCANLHQGLASHINIVWVHLRVDTHWQSSSWLNELHFALCLALCSILVKQRKKFSSYTTVPKIVCFSIENSSSEQHSF